MKRIAVAAMGEPGLDAVLCGHFGRCQFFSIVEFTDEGKPYTATMVPNTIHQPSPSGHGHNMTMFEEYQVEAIVAGNMGAPMYANLKQAGLPVFRGVAGANCIGLAVAAHDGELPLFEEAMAHQHHHGHSQGGCHEGGSCHDAGSCHGESGCCH